MKVYKIIFDGYIKNSDLDKMISNEYGKNATLISSSNKLGSTEAIAEFSDDIPYEIIELMTDGSVIVQQLILENKNNELFTIVEALTHFILNSDTEKFLSTILFSYMTGKNISFDEAATEIIKNIGQFNEETFNFYLGK